MKFISKNEEDTAQAARNLSGLLRAGDIICLEGDLGAGKTLFARALIRHLTGNAREDVPSPTFTLAQTYETPRGPVWHFDLYRLEEAEEIYELGWEEAVSAGIALIEWPERLGGLMPADRLTVRLEALENNANQREINFIPAGNWKERLS